MALSITLLIGIGGCSSDSGDTTSPAHIPISDTYYGKGPTDVGNPRELNDLANLYATMQRRFQAGDIPGVCARVSADMLAQFPPGDRRIEGPCTRQLTIYARQLRRGRARRPRLTIDWLRIYDALGIGGITATDDRGKQLRIPFLRDTGGWKLQLGVFTRPDTLNGTLVARR